MKITAVMLAFSLFESKMFVLQKAEMFAKLYVMCFYFQSYSHFILRFSVYLQVPLFAPILCKFVLTNQLQHLYNQQIYKC